VSPRKLFHAGVVLLLALAAAVAHAADRGVYTVVDGEVRVLRGTTWYRLEAGARAENGDIVDAGDRAQVQLELSRGGIVSMIGPAVLHAVALPFANARPGTPGELSLLRGWVKAAVAAKSGPLQLRAPTAEVTVDDGIVVVHGDAADVELFIERGRARLGIPAVRGKGAVLDAGAGEFWRRTGDRAFANDERPPPAFIHAMPREFRDALPSLEGHFPPPGPALAAGRQVSFAEAEPWLSGSSRRVFARRFAPRLADPAWRAAATAHSIRRRVP
jgi:hypothetical protein